MYVFLNRGFKCWYYYVGCERVHANLYTPHIHTCTCAWIYRVHSTENMSMIVEYIVYVIHILHILHIHIYFGWIDSIYILWYIRSIWVVYYTTASRIHVSMILYINMKFIQPPDENAERKWWHAEKKNEYVRVSALFKSFENRIKITRLYIYKSERERDASYALLSNLCRKNV